MDLGKKVRPWNRGYETDVRYPWVPESRSPAWGEETTGRLLEMDGHKRETLVHDHECEIRSETLYRMIDHL